MVRAFFDINTQALLIHFCEGLADERENWQ